MEEREREIESESEKKFGQGIPLNKIALPIMNTHRIPYYTKCIDYIGLNDHFRLL